MSEQVNALCNDIRTGWERQKAVLSRRIERIYQRYDRAMRIDPVDQEHYLSALYAVVVSANARHVIQTGTFLGFTALTMALALVDTNRRGRIDTIDPEPSRYGNSIPASPVSIARHIVERLGLQNTIIFHRGYSVRSWETDRNDSPDAPFNVLGTLSVDRSADVLVIDGDHSFTGAFWDLEIGYRSLNPHGPRIIFVHDYTSIRTVREAVRAWKSMHKPFLDFRVYDRHCGFALIQCHRELFV